MEVFRDIDGAEMWKFVKEKSSEAGDIMAVPY